jgi:branched-chain amino acid aminotransferase
MRHDRGESSRSVNLLCSIDGTVTSIEDARIGVSDDGFLRGDGAFEVLRLYDNRPFALADHLDRLDRSADGIFLKWDRAAFEREIAALLEKNEARDECLRLVLTRGGRRLAMVEQAPEFRDDMVLQSVTYEPTVVLTGLKTLSYAANMTATRIAQSRGAKEALLVAPGGMVMEAPTSTIFWAAQDGTLHTPRLDSGILASITRDRIMQLLPVEEGEYELADVLGASEVFLASSVREVQGVQEVDGVSFAAPGPVTQRVSGLLSERIQAELFEPSAETPRHGS